LFSGVGEFLEKVVGFLLCADSAADGKTFVEELCEYMSADKAAGTGNEDERCHCTMVGKGFVEGGEMAIDFCLDNDIITADYPGRMQHFNNNKYNEGRQ
jgi:hypothetical protein